MSWAEYYALFELAVGVGIVIYFTRYKGGPT